MRRVRLAAKRELLHGGLEGELRTSGARSLVLQAKMMESPQFVEPCNTPQFLQCAASALTGVILNHEGLLAHSLNNNDIYHGRIDRTLYTDICYVRGPGG